MAWDKPWGKGNRRVLVHGTPFFGKLFTETMGGEGWSFRYHPDDGALNLAKMLLDLRACDIVYQICGRVTLGKFLQATKYLGKKRVVVHWIGSDVLEAHPTVQAGKADPWLTRAALHWAETPWVAREVEALGVSCEMMALPGARLPAAVSPLPARFSVLVYIPGAYMCTYYGAEPMNVSTFYGLELILEVARELSHIDFHLVGLTPDQLEDAPGNLHVHGRVRDMTELYHQATVLWRPVRHDGLSFMVLEALAHGRHVLWSYDFPGCTKVASAAAASGQIVRLYEAHQQGQLTANGLGARIVAKDYAPHHLKRKIHQRLEELLKA
jgi:hypothetical protein